MWGVAGGLNDAEIAGVAAYFAGQKPKPNAAGGEAAKIAAGKEIFLHGKVMPYLPALPVMVIKQRGPSRLPV
ncbi:hypothetical protein CXB49_02525 [Chromobacterium sp. ATCC 53434]|nr:hypothetical protein CXB49_02525 [Chromobacterium sp. ATCC 53434]